MFAEIAIIAFTSIAAPASPLATIARGLDAALARAGQPSQADNVYKPEERAVANWRLEASLHLDLDPSVARAFAEGGDPRSVARCVKLNNYWCIKGAGWNGMLAADAEGHAAFSSAPEGAAVAALLLRRYYLDFSRRSAQSIVSRWAPAQCGYVASTAPARPGNGRKTLGRGIAQVRQPLGPDPLIRPSALATHGIGNTLRARYLASRGRGPRLARAGIRRSVIPDRTPPMMRTPQIATGSGSIEIALAPKAPVTLALLAERVTPMSFAPVMSCAGESTRIRNYAAKIIEGVTQSPDDDLKLFEPDGTPTGNLARVMTNMASVEIGPLKADPALVRTGIETATAAARQAAEANAARAASTKAAQPTN